MTNQEKIERALGILATLKEIGLTIHELVAVDLWDDCEDVVEGMDCDPEDDDRPSAASIYEALLDNENLAIEEKVIEAVEALFRS